MCGRGSRAVAAAAPSLQCDTHTSTAVADKNKTRPSGVVTRATGANNGHGDFSGQCPFTGAAPPCPPHSCTVVGRIAQAKDTLPLPFPLPLSREPGSRQTLPLRPLAFPSHKCQTGGASARPPLPNRRRDHLDSLLRRRRRAGLGVVSTDKPNSSAPPPAQKSRPRRRRRAGEKWGVALPPPPHPPSRLSRSRPSRRRWGGGQAGIGASVPAPPSLPAQTLRTPLQRRGGASGRIGPPCIAPPRAPLPRRIDRRLGGGGVSGGGSARGEEGSAGGEGNEHGLRRRRGPRGSTFCSRLVNVSGIAETRRPLGGHLFFVLEAERKK